MRKIVHHPSSVGVPIATDKTAKIQTADLFEVTEILVPEYRYN